tara:strand:- start:181 stop:300 length:120 start_codon:yes stop_codon:yes gene_type:complete
LEIPTDTIIAGFQFRVPNKTAEIVADVPFNDADKILSIH